MKFEKPHDEQAEQSVIGAMLLEADAIETARELLVGGEFHIGAHSRIYRAIINLADEGKPVDLVTLTAYLQDSDELSGIGGVGYLSKLAASVPSANNIKYYADRVKEMFLRRQNIETAMALLREAEQEQDTSSFIGKAEQAVSMLADQSVNQNDFVSMQDALIEVVEETEQLYNNRDVNRGVTGVPSGFDDLDRMTAGFQRSDLVIMAARPSVGKTAFALNIAQNVGIRAKETVAVFSLEMSKKQLIKRMISAEACIDASKMRTGFLKKKIGTK